MKSASQLVQDARARSQCNWFDTLSTEDKRYVAEVVDEIVEHPEVSQTSVARALISELNITRGISTVKDTLRKMLCERKQIS